MSRHSLRTYNMRKIPTSLFSSAEEELMVANGIELEEFYSSFLVEDTPPDIRGDIFPMPDFYRDVLKDKSYKYVVLKGGRGGVKTSAITCFMLEESFKDDFKGKAFLCLREIAKSQESSTRADFVTKISQMGRLSKYFYIPKVGPIVNKWTGVKFMFLGAKDNSGENVSVSSRFKNIDKIKGLSNLAYVFLEEASAFSKETLQVLFPTGRPNKVYVNDWVLPDEYTNSRGEIIKVDDLPEVGKKEIAREIREGVQNANKTIGNIRYFAAMNPRLEEDDILKELKKYKENTIVLHKNIFDMPPEFQAQDLLNDAENSKGSTDWDHVWLGEPLSLCSEKMIPSEYIKRADFADTTQPWKISWDKVVIAVDPAVTNKKNSDETGIMIIGQMRDNYYVLEDLSGRYSVDAWVDRVIWNYYLYKCNYIVIETNKGGDLLADTIKNANPSGSIQIRTTTATVGKHVRLEPVSMMYRSGRVYHLNEFPKLEEQLDRFYSEGYLGSDSPDRADALCWGLNCMEFTKNLEFKSQVYGFDGEPINTNLEEYEDFLEKIGMNNIH